MMLNLINLNGSVNRIFNSNRMRVRLLSHLSMSHILSSLQKIPKDYLSNPTKVNSYLSKYSDAQFRYSQLIWGLLDRRQHRLASAYANSLMISSETSASKKDSHDESILIALAAISSEFSLNRPKKGYRLLKKISLSLIDVPNPNLLSLWRQVVMHGLCITDNLVAVEALLSQWIQIRSKSHPSPSLAKLLDHINKNRNNNINNSNNSNNNNNTNTSIATVIHNNFTWQQWLSSSSWSQCEQQMSSEQTIPLPVLVNVVRLYSGRHCWKETLLVLDCIDEQFVRDKDRDEKKDIIIRLDSIVDRQCWLGDRNVSEQISIAYHLCLLTLCSRSNDLFHMAEKQLLPRMRSIGVNVEVVGQVAMSKRYSSSSVLVGSTGIGTSQNPDLQMNRQAMITESKELMKKILLLKKEKYSSGLAQLHCCRVIIDGLCRLHLLEEAEQTWEQILSERPDLGIMRVAYPLIHCLHLRGDWRRAREVFEQALPASGGMDESMAYHRVCEAMRRAGKIEELAKFITGR